ncbi:ArnT family glycosyltransferase [Legionella hackeliae]|uniref:Glycosyltransferase RgtA/B/C/D-like domain-containing protein n=1 Tax=Legionella hackeliae TaxID=449 RepID=A0A0A8UUM8_LEGHA|nr:glycosyltransferase family 39 protein [Legionella hackeliae]KTD15424.1 hypothetical protein Lhac_0266 [Legionella hackeliae]CEK11206.1 membrane protein of unknown function [Legionella hackeliae]STX47972.1 Uncharacterised protein [Legionella hackeliae]
MDIQTKKKRFWLEHPAISLLLITTLILLVRILLRGPVLLLDESEQVIMAQNLLPGYPNQPPLYTWLQYIFFQFFGVNLFSVALLKCCLLFGCFYLFYLISQIYCQNNLIAWCALASWALIPSIGLDLIKDNTHSILVLFAACLTWYWFQISHKISNSLWYSCFGVIIGIGILAKFNYVLFFIIFFISAISIGEHRKRLISPYMVLSLIMAGIVTSPYIYWLLKHPDLGFASAYKLSPAGIAYFQGLIQVIRASIFFAGPALIALALIFYGTSFERQKNALLYRYHLLSLPILVIITLLGGFRHFETRWMVPILFLCPLLYLSRLKNTLRSKRILFISLCISVQILFFGLLIYNSYSEQTQRKQLSLNQIIQIIKANPDKHDYIVSDSYWLLGNIATKLSIKKVWLILPSREVLPKGRSLMFWTRPQIPYWINLFAQISEITDQKPLVDSETNEVIGGQAFAHK